MSRCDNSGNSNSENSNSENKISGNNDSGNKHSEKKNQDMIGDLEKLKDFLDDDSTSVANAPSEPFEIPTLDTPIEAPTQSAKPKQNNPFIPYDAINRLKNERKNIRNFAAEAIEAAKQGLNNQTHLNDFDLFKYSEQPDIKASTEDASRANTKPSIKESTLTSAQPPIPKPDQATLNVMIERIIEEQRPKIEAELRSLLENHFNELFNSQDKK